MFPLLPRGPHTQPGQQVLQPAGQGVMWLEAGPLLSSCLCSDPGFTLLSSVVVGKLLNLLEPQLSHLFDGGETVGLLHRADAWTK